jgi:hypothetical protein
MPKSNKISVMLHRKSKKGRGGRISDIALEYRGPIVTQRDRDNSNYIEVVLGEGVGMSSSAGGVINNVISLDNPSSSSDWSSYANLFDEYRVLGVDIRFQPQNKYGKSALTPICVPLNMVVDRDSSGPLTSSGQAANYASWKLVTLENLWMDKWRMKGTREAVFVTTASPASTGAFLFYASGLTASTLYGVIQVMYRVQFRGTI